MHRELYALLYSDSRYCFRASNLISNINDDFDPVYMVPDRYGHDIKFDGVIIEKVLSNYHGKLTKLDVVTMRIWYRVNEIFECNYDAD